jgi:hypothetical protein
MLIQDQRMPGNRSHSRCCPLRSHRVETLCNAKV